MFVLRDREIWFFSLHLNVSLSLQPFFFSSCTFLFRSFQSYFLVDGWQISFPSSTYLLFWMFNMSFSVRAREHTQRTFNILHERYVYVCQQVERENEQARARACYYVLSLCVFSSVTSLVPFLFYFLSLHSLTDKTRNKMKWMKNAKKEKESTEKRIHTFVFTPWKNESYD